MRNKNIIVGITGGIAAYKTAELVRKLCNLKNKVRVVMTKNAEEFITPLTMQTLSGESVYTEMFVKNLKKDIKHISLARWADLIVVAPASANFIAKLANGIADDLLSTVCLSTKSPIAICPAMNKEMWDKKVTDKNISILKKRGFFIFGPASGIQACGDVGLGRMIEPEEIVGLMPKMIGPQIFSKKKVVITAGPTREKIDPVRYISNRSSGKMGFALAEAALDFGADVVLVSGPTNLECSEKIKRIDVESAKEMHKKVMKEINGCDIFIGAAAVSDYAPTKASKQKIKKGSGAKSIDLKLNPDILSEVASLKNKPFVVGFALETEKLSTNAKEKLKKKKLDMIVANQVGKDVGFESDVNEVVIFRKKGSSKKIAKMKKNKLAVEILRIIEGK